MYGTGPESNLRPLDFNSNIKKIKHIFSCIPEFIDFVSKKKTYKCPFRLAFYLLFVKSLDNFHNI